MPIEGGNFPQVMDLSLSNLENLHFPEVKPSCYLPTNNQISLMLHTMQNLSAIEINHQSSCLDQVVVWVDHTAFEGRLFEMYLSYVLFRFRPFQVFASAVLMLVQYQFGIRNDKLLWTHVAAEKLLVDGVSLAKIQFFGTVLLKISIGEPTARIKDGMDDFLIQDDQQTKL